MNAVLGLAMAGIVALLAIEIVLRDALLWGGLATVVAPPAAVTGRWTAMVPWPKPFVDAAVGLGGAFEFYPGIPSVTSPRTSGRRT